jgi:hypothetical protein
VGAQGRVSLRWPGGLKVMDEDERFSAQGANSDLAPLESLEAGQLENPGAGGVAQRRQPTCTNNNFHRQCEQFLLRSNSRRKNET